MQSKTRTSFLLTLSLSLLSSASWARGNAVSTMPNTLPAAIFGGVEVKAMEESSTHAVMLLNQESGGICTATVVGKKTLLTAAHCLPQNKDPNYLLAFFNISPFVSLAESMPVHVARMEIHPLYKNRSLFTSIDLALVILDEPIPEDYYPVLLPTKDLGMVAKEQKVELMGYGQTDQGSSGELRKVEVAVSRTDAFFFEVDQGLGKGICDGDSGGPAFIVKNNKHVLVAVSKMDYDKNYLGASDCLGYSLFTKVGPHLKWIKKYLQ